MTLCKALRTDIKDCLICTQRELVLFGAGLGFISVAKCPHSHKVSRQTMELSKTLRFLNVFCLTIFITAIVILTQDMIDLFKGIEHVTAFKLFLEKYVLWWKLVNTTMFEIAMVAHNKDYISSSNFFLRIIDTRKYYGVSSMLSSKFVRKMRGMILKVWAVFLLYLIPALSIFFFKEPSLKNLIVTVAYGFSYVTVLNITLYIVHTASAYTECFNSCYNSIKYTLQHRLRKGSEGTSTLTKLQYLQKLYLRLVWSYKRHILSAGNLIYFAEQFIFTVQIFVHGYLYTWVTRLYELKFECLILIDNIAMLVVVCIIFPVADAVYHSSDDVLSFISKFPTSKLTNIEADQVHMLVLSFTLEKPIMRASQMFTFGLPLVPALVSNIVTYVLVALQFDQKLKNRIRQ